MDGLDIDRRRAALLSRDENLDGSNKHCLLQIAWRTRKINEFHLNILLSNIKAQTDFCDWNLCQAVRLLFFEYDADMVGVLDCIRSELRSFPFWPMVSLEYCNNSFCYWSENHSFMFLSSAYLFQQIERGGRGPPRGRETAILRAALMAKLRGGPGKGLYEVLSHVYLPYTFCAMLNLIDFANDRDIVDMATAIADAIAYQFALATSDQGVVSLTASARYFARCRLRTFDHNVNQLMLIMAGIPVTFKIDSVTGFVLTSRYRPDSSIDFNKLIREERLILQWPMNHVANNLDDICAVYPDLTEEERVPFYWSAGLVTHPNFIEKTKQFQHKYHLENQIHLKALSWLPDSLSRHFMSSWGHWSQGQNYTGIKLNLYKAPGGLVLSSFEMYNPGLCGYQQMPWMANVAGVGVWSGSGKMDSLGMFNVQNLYNPHVSQKGKLLVSAYIVPPALLTLSAKTLLSRGSYVHWPSPLFDEELRQKMRKDGKTVWFSVPRTVDLTLPLPTEMDRISTGLIEDDTETEGGMDHIVWKLSSESDILPQCSDCVSISESSDDDDSESDEDETLTPAIVSQSTGLKVEKSTAAASKKKKRNKKKLDVFSSFTKTVRNVGERVAEAVAITKRSNKPAKGTHAKAWWIGRRGDALIGLCCTNKTKIETNNSLKDRVQLFKGGDSIQCPRRFCDYRKHAWIIRVGTLASGNTNNGRVEKVFESIGSFADHCVNNIDICLALENEGKSVSIQVIDREEGIISFPVGY